MEREDGEKKKVEREERDQVRGTSIKGEWVGFEMRRSSQRKFLINFRLNYH